MSLTQNHSQSNFNQALWLGIGQVCTYLITFVSAAVLSRYFDKTEYGTYKQILYVYNILQSLFTIGLPSIFSYFIPRLSISQQKTLINSMNRLFLFLGIGLSLTLFFLSGVLASLLNNPELALGLKLFSPFPLFTLPSMGVSGIYTALRKTRSVAFFELFSKTVMLLCIVLPVVLFHTGYKVAILGWGVASFLSFLVAMYMKNKPYVEIKKELIPNMYKTVFDYSLPLLGAMVAGVCISSADQFFISRYFGTETFAEFSNGCLSIPIIAMIAGPIKNVLLPLFSKADSEGHIEIAVSTYNNSVKKSVNLVYPVLFFCVFFAKDIMVFLYGEQYWVSGTFLRYFIIRDFVDVFPYLSVLFAIGATSVYMYTHIAVAVLTWVIDFTLVKLCCDQYSFVITSSLLQVFIRVVCFTYIFKMRKLNLFQKSLVGSIAKMSVHCVVVLLLLVFLKQSFMSSLSPFISLMICGLLFYMVLISTGIFLKVDYIEAFKMLKK